MSSLSLELHYHLREDAHSMNAHIRNKCEAETLAAFQHILEQLGVELEIETSAFEEGGLREIWKFVTKPQHAYPNLMLLLSLLVPSFITIWKTPTPDKEKEAIEKEISKLNLEERRLSIEKLRRELQETVRPPVVPASPSAPSASASGTASAVVISGATVAAGMEALSLDNKVIARRSNFYKTLLPYSKVTSIGLTALPEDAAKRPTEHVVERREFIHFILQTNRLPTDIVDEAVIEIVAPVIMEGGMQWKGHYLGEPISFAMKDGAFKGMVLRREVSFQSGDAIRCQLAIERKLDEVGEEVITGYSVVVVLDKIDSRGARETPQGKKQRFEKLHAHDQRDLLSNLDGGEPGS